MRTTPIIVAIVTLAGSHFSHVHAGDRPSEYQYQSCVRKGLEWLATQQFPDGHWTSSTNSPYTEAMTALSGMAFLMEGSTLRAGKYADRLDRAVQYLISRSQPNGLIGKPNDGDWYMYGHGFAMLFLASAYGEEKEGALQRKLEDVLTRAVLFTGQAQDKHGGWSYLSAADHGGDGGDNTSTVTQMQGLRAARNAGIVVPKEIIDKGLEYLRQTTNSQGGVVYSWAHRGGDGGRLPITTAALASAFSAGEYHSNLVKKWLVFCQKHIPMESGVRLGHDEYLHCYWAQCMYNLGEDRYVKLFPGSRPEDRLTWSKYRKAMFDHLMRSQSEDGSWNNIGWGIGRVYGTAMHLIILQLDNAALPIYQR